VQALGKFASELDQLVRRRLSINRFFKPRLIVPMVDCARTVVSQFAKLAVTVILHGSKRKLCLLH